MASQAVELIQRVQWILGVRSEFLDGVCEWYENALFARKVIKLLAPRRRGGRVSLTVNGRQMAGDAVRVSPQAREVTWLLGPGMVAAGDNEVAVYVEEARGKPLLVRAVQAYQEGVFAWETVDLASERPAPAAHLGLADSGGERRCREGWELPAGGYLTCRLRLPAALPVTFCLALPDGEEGSWFDDFKDVLEDLQDRIKGKLDELQEARRRAARDDPAAASRLDAQIADLSAYLHLQQAQIAPALAGGSAVTLQEVIRRTGDPGRLIDPWRPRAPAPVAPVAPPPVLPRPPGFRPPPRPAPSPRAHSSCLATCLTILLIGVLLLAGLAYVAWTHLPPPAMHFDAPGEGQTVAAGAPLQVWMSGEDLLGVQSISLSVEPGAEDLVQGAPDPAQLTFPSGTMDTGTRVVTLTLRPYAGPERPVGLVAVMKATRGTFTARRVVMVGGTTQSLVYEINPPQPKAMQPVVVVIHAVNAPPGARVSYTLQGTDAYHLEGTLEVGPDGTVRYEVKGAAPEVRDDLDAQIVGTGVRQKASYHFGE